MNFFARNNFIRKVIIIFTLITSVFFIAPKPVQADDEKKEVNSNVKMVCDLVLGLGDGITDLVHNIMLGQGSSVIRIDMYHKKSTKVLRVLITILIMGVVAAALFFGGATILGLIAGSGISSATLAASGITFVGVAAKATISHLVGVIVVTTIGAGYAGVSTYRADWWGEQTAIIPLYSITPEEMFRDDSNFPLFSVNFFDADKRIVESKYKLMYFKDLTDNFNGKNTITETDEEVLRIFDEDQSVFEPIQDGIYSLVGFDFEGNTIEYLRVNNNMRENNVGNVPEESEMDIKFFDVERELEESEIEDENDVNTYYEHYFLYKAPGTTEYVLYKINNEGLEEKINEGRTSAMVSDPRYPISYYIRDYVWGGYRALRTIATVGMMSVLVYIGIRIVIASAASDKAKYKEMLGDWLVGMVLLFTMHYIMYFANLAVNELTNFLNTINPSAYVMLLQDNGGEDKGDIHKTLKQYGFKFYEDDSQLEGVNEDEKNMWIRHYQNTDDPDDPEQSWYIEWHTNLMGHLRAKASEGADDAGTISYIGYTALFFAMIFITVMFMITYIRRLVYMAFLTIIAPLVALTYPLDKISDKKAQGFSFWIKEYIFNLLLQPMHLLLYTILVSTAIHFATRNAIYSLVAIGFIGQAEKILRKMFNFNKANTPPGMLSGAIALTTAMSGIKKITDTATNRRKSNSNIKEKVKNNIEETASGEGKNIGDYFAKMESEKTNGLTSGKGNGGSKAENAIGSNGNSILGKDSEKKENKRKIFNGISNGIGFYKDGIKRKFKRKLENAKPATQLAKLAVGTAGAVAMGSVGLAAGVASGDPSKALQYAGLSAAGGYRLGGNLIDRGKETFGVNGTSDQFKRAVLGEEEYKRQKKTKAQKEFIESEDNISKVMSKFKYNRKEAKLWLKANAVEYFNNGIDNVSDMIDIEKTIRKSKTYNGGKNKVTINNRDEAIGAYKIGKMYNSSKTYGKKKQEDIINEINNIGFKNREKAEAIFYASQIYNDIKNNINNG